LGGGWKIIARLKQPYRGFEPPPDSLPMAFQPKSKYRAYIEIIGDKQAPIRPLYILYKYGVLHFLLPTDLEQSLIKDQKKPQNPSFLFKSAISHHFIMGKMTHLQIYLL
jgi:hypothetical protein